MNSNQSQYKSLPHKFPTPIALYNAGTNAYTGPTFSGELDPDDYPDEAYSLVDSSKSPVHQLQYQQGTYYGLQYSSASVFSPHSPTTTTTTAQQQQQQQFFNTYGQGHQHFSSPSPSSPTTPSSASSSSTTITAPLPFAKKPDCMFYVKVCINSHRYIIYIPSYYHFNNTLSLYYLFIFFGGGGIYRGLALRVVGAASDTMRRPSTALRRHAPLGKRQTGVTT